MKSIDSLQIKTILDFLPLDKQKELCDRLVKKFQSQTIYLIHIEIESSRYLHYCSVMKKWVNKSREYILNDVIDRFLYSDLCEYFKEDLYTAEINHGIDLDSLMYDHDKVPLFILHKLVSREDVNKISFDYETYLKSDDNGRKGLINELIGNIKIFYKNDLSNFYKQTCVINENNAWRCAFANNLEDVFKCARLPILNPMDNINKIIKCHNFDFK